MKPGMKLIVDLGPLLAFFAAYSFYDLMVATAVLMVAIAISLAIAIRVEHKVPIMPLVTAVVVMVFGGLTLWLNDETFIKVKPTIVYGLFAGTLAGGLVLGRSLLKPLFGTLMNLDDAGWRVLSWRWAGYFVFVGVLNEIVWRTQSTDLWVDFKVFAILPLTIVFALAQTPFIQRHTVTEDAAE